MAGFVTNLYRDSVLGLTSVYSARIDLDTDPIFQFFNDDGTVAPAAATNFATSYATSENPAFADTSASPGSRLTVKTIGASAGLGVGIFDAADYTFTSSTVVGGSTSVESYLLAKFDTNAAASPNLARWDSNNATGLPFTPNSADVTVVFNAGGILRV